MTPDLCHDVASPNGDGIDKVNGRSSDCQKLAVSERITKSIKALTIES